MMPVADEFHAGRQVLPDVVELARQRHVLTSGCRWMPRMVAWRGGWRRGPAASRPDRRRTHLLVPQQPRFRRLEQMEQPRREREAVPRGVPPAGRRLFGPVRGTERRSLSAECGRAAVGWCRAGYRQVKSSRSLRRPPPAPPQRVRQRQRERLLLPFIVRVVEHRDRLGRLARREGERPGRRTHCHHSRTHALGRTPPTGAGITLAPVDGGCAQSGRVSRLCTG